MRWIGGPLMLALALGAGCLAPGATDPGTSDLGPGLGVNTPAATSFALDGKGCDALVFAFPSDAEALGEVIPQPFRPLGAHTGPSLAVALVVECGETMLDGRASGPGSFGGLFAPVEGPDAVPGAVNLYALQGFTDSAALDERLDALGAAWHRVPGVIHYVHPDVPGVGGLGHVAVPLKDGGWTLEGPELRGPGAPHTATWALWSQASDGFTRITLPLQGADAALGQAEFHAPAGSMGAWVADGESASGVLKAISFGTEGRVDVIAA